MNALDKACVLAESKARLARKIAIKPQALQQWLASGTVPADRVISVSKAVDFQVTPHELRPDLYPHPHDGLPDAMRVIAGAVTNDSLRIEL
jgi:DNA-binding transcriptional regulator YdaS (Cro superfamily)